MALFSELRWRKLAMDTALLTGSSLVMRCIAMAFQVWLAGSVGAGGVGLFQLIASVNVLCMTFAISGIRFAATRLVSEELGSRQGDVRCAVRRCMAYALFFGVSAFVILFLSAQPIGFLWIGDARTVKSLRIISFRMPFIAASSVINAYFIASGKVYKSACVQIIEQLCSISLVVFLLSRVPESDLELSCAAVSMGGTIADLISLALSAAVYFAGLRSISPPSGDPSGLTARMFRIALPLAVSAYARTSLVTLENLLVPRKLRESGLSASSALAGYGAITGMVFPIISFPSCILAALAELVVPELTAAQVREDRDYIRRTVSALLRCTLVFSIAVSSFIFFTADALGALIYKTEGLGHYIRILSLLAPPMYLDIVTDGCLKGLGQMINSMRYNICEALIGVVLVVFLLPRWALKGYICVLFVCEFFNFAMSINRLRKVVWR